MKKYSDSQGEVMELEIITKRSALGTNHPPLLLVHGAWHGAWCWERFQSFFAKQGYESHAVSLRGHGKSEKYGRFNCIRLRDYVDDVYRAASRLPRPPVLVGHSMGGLIIRKYLASHAAPAAVLLAPIPAHGVYQMFFRFGVRHPWRAAKCLLAANTYALIETPRLAREAFFSSSLPEDQCLSHCELLQKEPYAAGWDTLLFDFSVPPAATSTPLLVLGASRDALFHRPEIEATARACGTNAEFIDDTAHDMMLERTWETTAARIAQWLAARGF